MRGDFSMSDKFISFQFSNGIKSVRAADIAAFEAYDFDSGSQINYIFRIKSSSVVLLEIWFKTKESLMQAYSDTAMAINKDFDLDEVVINTSDTL